MSTDFVVAVPNNKTYILYDIYNPWKAGGASINATKLASWTRNSGLKFFLTQRKFERRANLHGLSLNAAFFGVS